jgi:hypothetical protein
LAVMSNEGTVSLYGAKRVWYTSSIVKGCGRLAMFIPCIGCNIILAHHLHYFTRHAHSLPLHRQR